ncbi:translation initiation factor IF-6 [Candidatus Micrarchaeota archaeon]|nr:translation initiation factor IF-6 [Candidatus Micrarchaeota archaeon]
MVYKNISYFGNPYIGLFLRTNETHTLVPLDATENFSSEIERFLKTETFSLSIYSSNLIGIYTAMNSSGIVLPNMVDKKEVEKLKKLESNIYVSSFRFNAFGNNFLVNDNAGIANPDVPKTELKKISDVLGIEIVPRTIAGYKTVGAACVATNKGFLAHYACPDEERKELESILKVKGSIGSVNRGTGFIALGVSANSKGYVCGESTTAFEMGRIEEGLDFIG